MKGFRTAALLLPLALVSCDSLKSRNKQPFWKTQSYNQVSVKPQATENQIPESLWKQILALNVPAQTRPGAKSVEKIEAEKLPLPETTLESLKVYLSERNKGVLKSQNVALSFAAGGGELDLSTYVGQLRGSYSVAFEFMPEHEIGQTKIFFLSNSVIRKVGNDKLGSGCNTYFEITQALRGSMKKDGFLVNTSDQRDVSALAGTFVFVNTDQGKLHMATLIVRDDRYRALQCRH